MEVTDAASYEEEIRAMAKEGYDLILTTFSPMTEATKAVAADYPDVKFAAIFQNINVDGETYANVWIQNTAVRSARTLLARLPQR